MYSLLEFGLYFTSKNINQSEMHFYLLFQIVIYVKGHKIKVSKARPRTHKDQWKSGSLQRRIGDATYRVWSCLSTESDVILRAKI